MIRPSDSDDVRLFFACMLYSTHTYALEFFAAQRDEVVSFLLCFVSSILIFYEFVR